jgi:hypothetical protein
VRLIEKLFPSLLIRRAANYSSQLEEDTGFSLRTVEGEDGFMFFLIDPYGDGDDSNSDWWSDLDDAIFDLSDFRSLYYD